MMLPVLAVLCLASAVTPVPVYGTTRYGRPPWAYRGPPAYYRQPYPYQTYPDEMYYRPDPMMHYPYYPMPRSYGKNEVYQTLYPYYYSDRMRPYYYSNENSYAPGEDLGEDLHDDGLRTNGRADALPVGQETWFEGESVPRWSSDYDDVNAAFLQNLIMSQVYNDNLNKNEQNESEKAEKTDSEDYERNSDYYGDRDTRDFEDEDVRELKALAGKPLYHSPKTSSYTGSDKKYKQWYGDYTSPTAVRREEDHYTDDYPSDEPWINWGSKRSKQTPTLKTTVAPSTTTRLPSTTKAPVGEGQKEEVLLRPATPVRHPFPEPVLKLLAANNAQKRTPSVYDTIKQMLSMDEPFAQKADNKGRLQKRFVATEEDLVGELKGLKRRSPA